MSAVDEVYEFGHDVFNIPERGEIRIRNCPPSITDRLRRASFSQTSSDVFTKTQQSLDSEREYEVVNVTVAGDGGEILHVEATDIVGIVSLTPSSKVQVDPKIEWKYIFDMLLAVYDQNRSLEYHGVPLQEFLSGDIQLEDVFVVLAINYLNGIETIQQNGYIRDLVPRRTSSLDGRGSIDVEQTLLNHARGQIQPQWIHNETEYDNAVNSLLHFAGNTLLRIFRQHASETDHPAYDRIFSEVHREVDRLEDMGVDSGLDRIDAYRALSLYDLPTQRQYYRTAFDISKAVLSSSLGQQLRDGHRELVVDYVLNMESLFEQYSQAVIERELEQIKSYDHLNALDDVTPVQSPSVEPFEGERSMYHEPDHAVQEGKETLAILDSKYYAKGHNPVRQSPSRSRLFSYAYLLDSDRLAFLCPLLDPRELQVTQTGAELQIVSPDGEFGLDAYGNAIHEYLRDVLTDTVPALEAFSAVASGDNELCLDDAEESDLQLATELSGPFTFSDGKRFSLRIINAAAETHSLNVQNRYDLEDNGGWTRDQIRTQCKQRYEYTTTCVPVFVRDDGVEVIELYFIDTTSGNVEKEGPFRLFPRDG
jgi:McrBC 5-methylcytosine restriction system component.